MERLKKGTFNVVQFAKYGKWNYSKKEEARNTIDALYTFALKAREAVKDKVKKAFIKSGLKNMYSLVTDESPSSEWNTYWSEKKDRELETEERLRRKRKIISLVNEEVIQVANEQQAKLRKVASKKIGLIPQVPQILHASAFSVPIPLQNVSDCVGAKKEEYTSFIIDFNSDGCLSQISFDVFSDYTDYIQSMWSKYLSTSISEYTKSVFAPLKSMSVDLWESYFKDLVEPNSEIEQKVKAVIKSTIPALYDF
ncbi:hypothetical protein HK100_010776 [Physocladia obscura]|uniref:Uncharacterized protein n=1 Tax=Physocladia obscura TaxID=109957 RepID=A0AAD5XIQ2_9FUNG|nr:hypothetical protein HK100_010776 [Physocladia obscura]